MKNYLLMVVLVLSMAVSMQAQTIPVSSSQNVHVMMFQQDTTTAVDTTRWIFYAPFKMTVVGMHAIASYADTGAASPAGIIKLYKYGTSTTLIADTVTAANTVAYDRSISAATGVNLTPVTLSKGSYYKIGKTLGSSDKLYNLRVFLFYTN